MQWSVLLVLVLACGDQLAPLPCSIACADGCPDGATCSVGFCAGADETCAPELQQLTAGAGFACGLDQYGRAWCWGDNTDRQLADSERAAFTLATVSGGRRWDAISAGAGHVCAIDEGELWCWGRNDRNQVTSAIVGDVAAPVRIEVDGATVAWTAVAAGVDSTCGIAGGRLRCWGAGSYGKLGTGTPDDLSRPTAVETDIADWIAVDTGARHTCAISASLGVWCWGDGSSGQLGNDRRALSSLPVAAGVIGATRIAVGLDSTCAIGGGALFCWGRAAQGALGDPASIDPATGDRLTATRASTFEDWVELESGEAHACGRRANGRVYCWGTARAGGLGGGRWDQRGFVEVLDGATALAVGWNGTDADLGRDDGDLDLACATVDGRVRCWGDNRVGQLAQGGVTRSATPVEVTGDRAWSALAAGGAHVCGLDATERAVYCWGSVERGQLAGAEHGLTTPCTQAACDAAVPVPVDVAGVDALVAGANHTCARAGTQLTCWGDNRDGQAAPAAAAPTLAPTALPGAWSRVFAGANGTCGGDAASLACWGAVADAPSGGALAGATALGLGFEVGCALDATGALACFGDSTVFGNGTPGSCGDAACNNDETAASCPADCGTAPVSELGRSYAAIAVGRRPYACGITAAGGVECWGDNARGQLGTFELSFASTPQPIASPAGCTQLAAGRDHVCAVCSAGITCWGEPRHGELGGALDTIPELAGRTTPPPAGETWASVTVGDGFTCGTTSTQRALCWGSSLHGALGTGARGANLPIPIKLDGE